MAAAALPALRDELTLYPGPVRHDGSPTWTLHDPLRNQFFQLSWPAFEVLARWGLGSGEAIVAAVRRETTVDLDIDDVAEIAAFLARSQLLKPYGPAHTKHLLALHDAAQGSWMTWLLHHYLFFRIPLVRPDEILTRALPLVAWIGTRGFRLATLGALLAGLFLVGRQWDSFATTFVDHMSVQGVAAFGAALAFAKVIHELGHAFTAKRFGCRVPTMGVAFLVMWPVLYTDVNEAWKLTARRQRLLVGSAGIVSELCLAIWATLAWGLLPEGNARAVAFTLAATTWISSLAINLSPFMRFDGYFLAMDALEMPNLHHRAFALARWHLREVLFGLGESAPEPLPGRKRLGLIVFAWAVWLYRLFLFLGIAALVYSFFIKVVGVLLFLVEIGWFVLKPIAAEIREWHKRGRSVLGTRRSRITLGLIGAAVLLFVVPWSGRVSAPALLKAEEYTQVYAPAPAVLREIVVRDGQTVSAGAEIARLDDPDLGPRLDQVGRRIALARYELAAMGFEESFRTRAQAIAKELEVALAEQAALLHEREKLILTAPFDGTVHDLTPDLHPGQWVSLRDPLLGVSRGCVIDAYVAEEDVDHLAPGMTATFVPEGHGAALTASVGAIDRVAVRTLADPVLATPFGGTLPARITRQSLVPDTALYRVRIVIAAEPPGLLSPVRGEVIIDGHRHSMLGRVFRSVAAALVREFGT